MKENLDVFTNKFAYDIFKQKYSMDGQETWADLCKRVVSNVCGQHLNQEDQQIIYDYIYSRKFVPAGRYLYASGRPLHQIANCFAFEAEDSREGWGELAFKATQTLMTGGGIGVEYSKLREEGAIIKRTGGVSSGPIALIHMINEIARNIQQGGSRRSAVWAGLNWLHPDIFDFMACKNHTDFLKMAKEQDMSFPLPLELTNISVGYDTEFFLAINDRKHQHHKHAKKVWDQNCLQAFSTAEPGFSFNYLKDNESKRNACTEYTTEDDSDSCNLGTVWTSRFDDIEDFRKCVKYATKFLICGGAYTDTPFDKCKEVRDKNNNIGLGLGGLHEFLIQRNQPYSVTSELEEYYEVYKEASDESAYSTAKDLGMTQPKKKRAIAPNGTIGILAESTTGIEPLFCKAYQRRYLKDDKWVYQYVVDGAIKRAMDKGVDISNVQDSFDIPFKDRVEFQAKTQKYVDMAISSTCNLPAWGTETNNEETLKKYSKTLLKYGKQLRGFTAFPDGCRSNQPLTRVPLEEALTQEGIVFEEEENRCAGVGGSCSI